MVPATIATSCIFFSSNKGVRAITITFFLTEEPSVHRLPASNIEPQINGKKVTYEIRDPQAGLILNSKNVPWDWWRWKSWYDVDRLEIVVR